MSPTIILKNERLYGVLGGSGGSVIITAVLQAILNVLDFDANINQAINFPRYHSQLIPVGITMENGFPNHIHDGLVQMGHNITMIDSFTSAVQGIIIDDDNNLLSASDKRKMGFPAGY